MDPTADEILRKLLKDIPGIKEAAIVSADGLPIASALPPHADETMMAAITTSLHSLSKRANIEMNKGDFDQLYLKGSNGYLLVMDAGDAFLMQSVDKKVRLGAILLDNRRICEKITSENLDSNEFYEPTTTFPFITPFPSVVARMDKPELQPVVMKKTAVVISKNGMPITSTLPKYVNKMTMGLIAPTLLSLSEIAIFEMKKVALINYI